MKTTRRRGEPGVAAPTLVFWTVVVLFVVVVAVALYRTANRPAPIPTDANGSASFDTQGVPQIHVSSHCDPSGGSPKFSNAPQSNTLKVEYKELSSTEDSCTQGGKTCKQKKWIVQIDQTFYQDLDPRKTPKDRSEQYEITCPCWCPQPKTLNLKWHDIERRPYPNGERATYYNVQFVLTDLDGKQLGTWTAWVRFAGGHTHYGAVGSKLIRIEPGTCSTEQALVECAKNQSGFQYSGPPVS
jgi:hypothetical protein